MTSATNFLFEDPDHFEEGLLHLVDMLELADPRRMAAHQSQAKVVNAGVGVPVGGSFEDWRNSCLSTVKQLQATREQVESPDGRALIDATIDRIQQMVE